MTLEKIREMHTKLASPISPAMLESEVEAMAAFKKDMPRIFMHLLKIAEKAVPYRNFAVALTGGGALDHAFIDLETDPE